MSSQDENDCKIVCKMEIKQGVPRGGDFDSVFLPRGGDLVQFSLPGGRDIATFFVKMSNALGLAQAQLELTDT